MKLSEFYLKTYKTFPYEIGLESTRLLYRSGLIKFFEDASFSYTPMGKLFADRLKSKIKDNFKEHMEIEIGFGEEKSIAGYAAEIKSYKEIPLNLSYEVEKENKDYKFKDGLLNPRSDKRLMILSFAGEEFTREKYGDMKEALKCILSEAGLNARTLEDENGMTFVLDADYPLKSFIYCEQCGYGGCEDSVKSLCNEELSTEDELEIEHVHTPSVGTIADLESFFDAPADRFIKTLLFDVKGEIIAVLLRGDKSINLNLLAKHLRVDVESIAMASEEQVNEATSAEIGFAGPIGLKAAKILCDAQVCSMKNAVVGANKTDYHIKNVNYKRDFEADEIGVFRTAQQGDICPRDKGELRLIQGSELAYISILQEESKYLNEAGREEGLFKVAVNLNMDRIMAAIVEKNSDEIGILWPEGYAPFEYHVIVGNSKKEEEAAAGENIYKALLEKGIGVLLDDRKERIGSKFKDSELLGIKNVVVAGKLVSEGKVEHRNRKEGINREAEMEEFSK